MCWVSRRERGKFMLRENSKDVARGAGVSPATVSQATRVRVRAVADELGHVSSPSGSRPVPGCTGTVGVVVPYIDRWFFGRVIAGIERVVRGAGFDLLLYNV